uniref:Ig-like domain-containing protein n=1 Tax=Salarias fasciatus TaxID=181472 RepID=A0A672F1C6_SALFA
MWQNAVIYAFFTPQKPSFFQLPARGVPYFNLWELATLGSVQRNVSAVEGQTVSLPCEAPNNNETILVVSWTRPDLGNNQDVFLYRDGHFDPDNHPSYQNRVDLKDREMKDGDVSLILKNVTFNDSGTYQCFIVQRGENTNDTESLSSVSLSVVPGLLTCSLVSFAVEPYLLWMFNSITAPHFSL